MMIQIKQTLYSTLFLVSAILNGCTKGAEDTAFAKKHEAIEVGFTRTTGNSSTVSALLIFWQSTPGDLFTAEIANLNDYRNSKYNTGEAYPEDKSTIHATGISPMTMKYSEGFQTLNLPEGTKAGTLDVCATSSIDGNSISPFNAPMIFEHTLTKVKFYAERHKTMVGSRNVGNINITVPAASQYLPTQWIWNATYKKYEADPHVYDKTDLVFNFPGTLFETETQEIGTAYLMLPVNNTGQLENIQISAEITPIASTEVENMIQTTLPAIQLYKVDNKTAVSVAKPGEAYEILVVFQQNSFTLTARQQEDWDRGGLIYVPVKP